MNIKLYDKALFRVPQFPTNATLKESWTDLKLSIKDASDYFYNTIKNLDSSDIEEQPQNIKNTIAKYYNRARFRATPYGTFASIGTVKINKSNALPIILPGVAQIKSYQDWSDIKSEVDNWRKQELETLTLQVNTSYYEHNGAIRYIYCENNKFEISEITNHPEITYILKRLKEVNTFNEVLKDLPPFEFTAEDWRDLVSELIEYQLIFTDKNPAIISTDMAAELVNQDIEEKSYKIGVQQPISGALSVEQLKALTETVNYLNGKRLTHSSNTELEEFIQKFQKRYDQQAVPIMKALDPIIGIGYGNYATVNEQDLVQKLNENKFNQTKQDNTDNFKKLLNNSLLGNQRSKTIQMESLHLPDNNQKTQQLPNTFSALIKVSGDHIQLSQLGGVTANALLGRFTLASDEVYQQCRELANIEQQANPEIIFFDVAYAGEPDVDNINRRQRIYEHTIAIHNYIDGTRIDLTDVYLKVIGSEMILFSKKLHMRLIPRIATAYNYTRSDLPLFRLLCDLQRQGLINNLKPDLHSLTHGAEYLPRLQYKQVIVSLRAWLLKYDNRFEIPSFFDDYVKTIQIDQYIQVGSGDQTLRIDTGNTEDKALLASILKLRKELWAEEYPTVDAEIINDQHGNPYCSEFIISYYQEEQIYSPLPPIPEFQSVQRLFPPGSEWLYFEIYAHSQIQDWLLTGPIPSITKSLKKKIKAWFFIRYNEDGDHLRLRFRLQDKKTVAELMSMMFQEFHNYLKNGMIRDMKLCTYKREIERYAYAGMERVEKHFEIDSEFALVLISKAISTHELYANATRYILDIGTTHFSIVEFTSLVMTLRNNFAAEHRIQKEQYKLINNEFNVWQKRNITCEIPEDTRNHIETFKISFLTLLKNLQPGQDRYLFGDLVHMHLNRIFTHDQRTHEYIIYEYLYKLCVTMKYESMIKI